MPIELPKHRFGNSGGNRLPKEGKRHLIVKPARKRTKKPFFPEAIIKAAHTPYSHSQPVYLVERLGKNKATYGIPLGEKVINNKMLMDAASAAIKKSRNLARKKVGEVTGYSLADLMAVGDLPKLGSIATGKIEVTSTSKGNHILLSGIAFPSGKLRELNSSQMIKLKNDVTTTFYRRLDKIIRSRTEFRGSTLEVRVKLYEKKLIGFLQGMGYEVSPNEISEEIVVLKKKF